MASSSTGSKINVSNCTINSGYCSGNKRALECISKTPRGGCKGTVRSFCVKSGSPLSRNNNSGAFSGGKGEGKGSADEGNRGLAIQRLDGYEDSQVIGTLQSFNIGTGIPPGCKPGESFKAIDRVGEGKPTIHGKYCAGTAAPVKNALKGKDFESCKCKDTEYSFNAENGEKINAMGATLNTGAFAGIGGS